MLRIFVVYSRYNNDDLNRGDKNELVNCPGAWMCSSITIYVHQIDSSGCSIDHILGGKNVYVSGFYSGLYRSMYIFGFIP